METKLIAMILGVVLVLATATVYIQSVFAATTANGGNGIIPSGTGGAGGVGDVCLSCIGTSHDSASIHAAIHSDISALRAGLASEISALRAGLDHVGVNHGAGGLGCSPLDPRGC